MSEQRAPYTPHGTEEREVFLAEPAIGDPGDETTEKPSVGVNRCWNCGQMYVADHDHLCRFADTRQGKSFAVGMAPSAEEMAAAIRRCAELRPRYLRSYDDYHQWRLALDAIDALAARLPQRGR